VDPILTELQQAAEGLLFRSESDYPFDIVDLGLAGQTDLTPAQLLSMLGRPEEAVAETIDLPYFFRNMTRVRPEYTEEMKQEAQRFQALEQLLTQKLSQVKVFRFGAVNVEAYILGTTPKGRLVGLKTRLIET